MNLLVITLAFNLSTACPMVQHYRDQGMSDEQIEVGARARHVPEWVIRLAKKRCAKPLTPR